MNLEIKKDLASNWFKSLQNSICNTICKLENNKINLIQLHGKETKKKMKAVVNIEFYKMARSLIK